jgi:hypothetical protein
MSKNDRLIELIAIVTCLFFAVAMSLYHLSFNGYLGLSTKNWILVWAIAENGLPISLSVIVSLKTEKLVRFLFRWLMPIYFIIRFTYHLSCYYNVNWITKESRDQIWSFELVILILIGLFCCAIYLKTEK